MEPVLAILVIMASIVSFVCFIIVLVGMAQDWGILVAIIGFCLCQLLVFVYGWFFWDSDIKFYVMGVWTMCILLFLGIEFGMGQSFVLE